MTYLITPESEVFFKSGLAKSVFKPGIYLNIPVDYFIPYMNQIHKILEIPRFKSYVMPKFYQVHDSFLMFYRDYPTVSLNLKKSNKAAPTWLKLIRSVVSSDKFQELNRLTRNSEDLSIVAAVNFLKSVLSRLDIHSVDEKLRDYEKKGDKLFSEQISKEVDKELDDLTKRIDDDLTNTIKQLNEYNDLKETAEEIIETVLGGRGGSGFTKEVLSVFTFMKQPDDFRKRVTLLKNFYRYLNHFTAVLPTSFTHQQIVSQYGSISGTDRMVSSSQLKDILPSELVFTQLGSVGRALLASKISANQVMVYQRSASLKPVLFVDKSGSMAEPFRRSEVEKIAAAAGLALAMYRKYNADVYLFDTEVEKVNPNKIVEVLLTISADGGTNIDPVLEEIMRIGKPDYLYIVISDGITEADPEVLKKFEMSGLARRTKLVLIYPGAGNYNWVALLNKYNNVYSCYDIADFENKIRKSID